MSLLNYETLYEIGQDNGISSAVVERVALAVIAKLAAGVSVEPVAAVQTYPDGRRRVLFKDSVVDCDAQWQTTQILYTATAIAAARVQENERCEEAVRKAIGDSSLGIAAQDAIRALIGANHG